MLQSSTNGNGRISMVYMDRLCIDFGGRNEIKMGNNIGRACNMSHAE